MPEESSQVRSMKSLKVSLTKKVSKELIKAEYWTNI